ncbi:MAG TPA: M14 family zinc carboxypeptidase [Gemmatimonadales bacterium]
MDRIGAILDTAPAAHASGDLLGYSREGRPVRGFRFGSGATRISLIGGCHADEPVGPLLLRKFSALLGTLAPGDVLLTDYSWWVVPHVNPDGEHRNRSWYDDDDATYDLARYLMHVTRELPGDDIEFGFPRADGDRGARPENRAVAAWWRETAGPFSLHATLHGMGFAAGPWFLIEETWADRCGRLMERCVAQTATMGYTLHDVERRGEKGFVRLARGFTTRPDSRAMRAHFHALGDDTTAELFRPSSMETIRAHGGDPLTLVSEMPLFLTPGVGEALGPPDPVAVRWQQDAERWRAWLAEDPGRADAVRAEAAGAGLRAMPVRDQMTLQWTFIAAGLEQIRHG